jgi:hypothetical protein
MPWRLIGEWRYSSTHFLTAALGGGEWSASRPSSLAPRERAPDNWIGGCVAVWTRCRRKKFPAPPGCEPRSFDRPTRSQSLYSLRYPGFGTKMFHVFFIPPMRAVCPVTHPPFPDSYPRSIGDPFRGSKSPGA